jgi:ABC-type uncharacterized transport system involved in gliding motility auxiliary subunit
MTKVVVAIVIAVLAGNWWLSDHDVQIDLSAAHRFSLSSETRHLIGAVDAPLHVTVFLTATGNDANDARFLLDRYHELNHRITYSVVDPDADPGLARRFGITDYSTVVLQYRGRRVDAPDAEELELSTGILEILRGSPTTVCVLTGHGEDSLTDTSAEGFSEVASLLQSNDYSVQTLDLTTGVSPSVPSDCVAVLIDGPRDPLAKPEIAAISAYAASGGRLLVLATPLSNADPNPILNQWGIHFIGGLVVDPQRAEGTDLSNLIVEDLPSTSPVDQGVSTLEMPAPGALAIQSNAVAGLTVEDLAASSGASYVAPDPSNNIGYSPGDQTGPIVIAAAADASQVVAGPSGGPSHVLRTRVLTTGTDIWAVNQFLDQLSNRRFLLNGLAWLTERDQLVVATDRPDQPAALPFTNERQQQVIVVTILLIPGAILALGLLRYLWRRRSNRT